MLPMSWKWKIKFFVNRAFSCFSHTPKIAEREKERKKSLSILVNLTRGKFTTAEWFFFIFFLLIGGEKFNSQDAFRYKFSFFFIFSINRIRWWTEGKYIYIFLYGNTKFYRKRVNTFPRDLFETTSTPSVFLYSRPFH